MRNKLRLYSGLILFFFVCGHFLNHILGLVSLEWMNAGRAWTITPWRTLPGTVLLTGAALVHAGAALWSLWMRRNLKLPVWELVQLVFGLMIPLFLAAHVAGTRGLSEISQFQGSYETVLSVLWLGSPVRGGLHALALIVVWGHSCVGLHFWLRLKPGYARLRHVAYGAALIIPSLALAGYVAAGVRVRDLAAQSGWGAGVAAKAGAEPWMPGFVYATEDKTQLTVVALVVVVLVARAVRRAIRARSRRPRLYYAPGARVIDLGQGATLLESIRAAGVDHASLCGGRGRCSTCRVRISKGAEQLTGPADAERRILSRISASPSVRLACQIRPTADLEVTALLPPDVSPADSYRQPSYRQGREMDVTYLFVDLRGSTKLGEDRLPFDVVFVLNQFFAELSAALEETNGHYAQFNGDGLLAIYGLDSGPEKGAVEALSGAQAMFRRIDELNQRLEGEVAGGLRIGIGIHKGEAIVGTMGPPKSPIVTALGDNVNIAARLEAQTKEFGVPLVVSADTAQAAGLDLSGLPRHAINVKGRDNQVAVYAIAKPMTEIRLIS